LWRSTAACDLLAQLKILDGHLAGRDWFALDRFTIADIALGSIVKRCLEFPIERPACSELARWQPIHRNVGSSICWRVGALR
jgi:glutathione S-transferase